MGFLANDDKAAVMYARWTEKACTRDGICYELRRVEKHALEAAVIEANTDPSVHGIMVYYPCFGGAIDDCEPPPAHTLASARHHHTAGAARRRSTAALARRSARCDFSREGRRGPQPPRYALYHNIRTLAEHNGKKCVLPCTPLAVAKILSALGMFEENAPVGRQLKGRTVVVVNRSEVVGRPLAAMCAP